MTRKVFRLAIAALGLLWALVTPTTTQAIAPSNDDFDSAAAITALPFTDTVNTSEATTAADDPDCVGQGPTVWYAFTPSADILIEANTFGSSYDTTLSAYTGQRGTLTQIACNDDFGSLQSKVTFTANAGVTIFFMVGAFASGPGGNLVFNLMEFLPPPPAPNDDFSNATVITGLPFTDRIDTTGATTAADDPDCVGQGPTVWYSFIPSTDLLIEANTFGSDYDTTLSAYTIKGRTLTQITCNDDTFGLQSRISFTAKARVRVLFMVGAFASGPGGNLVFNVSELAPPEPAPPNDDRENATVITGLPFTDIIDTTGATRTPDDQFCFSPPGDTPTVWYAFTPCLPVTIRADTFGSSYNTTLSVWTEDEFGNLQFFTECNDDAAGSLQSQVFFEASPGVTYFFMVDSFDGPPGGNLQFHVDVHVPPPELAELVFGQFNFFDHFCNSIGRNASSICAPTGAEVDAVGNLYVADRGNNRVLVYFDPLTTDMVADRVIGQPNFFTGTCNTGGRSASSLCSPTEVALDDAGSLYVADLANNRVLVYFSPLTTDMVADRVIGQPDFVTGTCNTGGLSASSLCVPSGVAVDFAGNLYVGEFINNRVLVYFSPLTTDAVADRVIGQPDFTTNTCNTGGLSASSLCIATGVEVDSAGNLYVSDTGNERVLEYDSPLTTDTVADRVFGQPDFVSDFGVIQLPDGTFACSTPTASSLCDPRGVAVDAAGSLYVADSGISFANPASRVVVYKNPLTTDALADQVFGQPDFTSAGCNGGDFFAHAYTHCTPRGVAVDATSNLYIADTNNSRVLVHEADADSDGIRDSQDSCPSEAPTLGLDADRNGCTDTLEGLQVIVKGLPMGSAAKNGLLGKLNEVEKALSRGNTRVAVSKLHDFIDQVEGARGHGIKDCDADLLVAYANNLIVLISP